MNGSAATNEKFDNYSNFENGLFTYTYDENKLNASTDSNNYSYIDENKLNTTTDGYNYSYIDENKLNTTTNSNNYSYIDESLELLNDNSIDPLRRLELKRELVEYISYVKANEPLMLKEYMSKINNSELMKNFHKYFYYNG